MGNKKIPTLCSSLVRKKLPSCLAHHLKEHCHGNATGVSHPCLASTSQRAAESLPGQLQGCTCPCMKGEQLHVEGGITHWPGPAHLPWASGRCHWSSLGTIMFHPKMMRPNLKVSFKHFKSIEQPVLLIGKYSHLHIPETLKRKRFWTKYFLLKKSCMNKSSPYNQERNPRKHTLAVTLEKHLVINTHDYITSVILNSVLRPHWSETCQRE